MSGLKLEKLRPEVVERIRPFFDAMILEHASNIHSLYVVGSSLTGDFNERTSDINSISVLKKMDLKFLEALAPMGKKYRKQKIAAPLIMTPEYIMNSSDVFPVEFLSFKLIHETVYGEDIFSGVEIRREDLRHQCERELKVKLIGLRQGFISTMGNPRAITDELVRAITGYIPLFRGIIMLLGDTPPVGYDDVLSMLSESTGVDCGIFRTVLAERREKIRLGKEEVESMFEAYYTATEGLGKVVDEITA